MFTFPLQEVFLCKRSYFTFC